MSIMRVISTLSTPKWTLDFDEYIAATVRWATERASTPFYFRLRDDGPLLIEIGVDPRSHAICKLNVVSIRVLRPVRRFPHHTTSGLPVVEPSLDWVEPLQHTDIHTQALVGLDGSTLVVQITNNEAVERVFDAGGASFAVDPNGEIASINIPLPGDARMHRARLEAMVVGA